MSKIKKSRLTRVYATGATRDLLPALFEQSEEAGELHCIRWRKREREREREGEGEREREGKTERVWEWASCISCCDQIFFLNTRHIRRQVTEYCSIFKQCRKKPISLHTESPVYTFQLRQIYVWVLQVLTARNFCSQCEDLMFSPWGLFVLK